jgi:hypothetical protein
VQNGQSLRIRKRFRQISSKVVGKVSNSSLRIIFRDAIKTGRVCAIKTGIMVTETAFPENSLRLGTQPVGAQSFIQGPARCNTNPGGTGPSNDQPPRGNIMLLLFKLQSEKSILNANTSGSLRIEDCPFLMARLGQYTGNTFRSEHR